MEKQCLSIDINASDDCNNNNNNYNSTDDDDDYGSSDYRNSSVND